jgi:hypothetical protein
VDPVAVQTPRRRLHSPDLDYRVEALAPIGHTATADPRLIHGRHVWESTLALVLVLVLAALALGGLLRSTSSPLWEGDWKDLVVPSVSLTSSGDWKDLIG